MRYSFYVFIRNMNKSIKEAVEHVKNSGNPLNSVGLLADSAEAIAGIYNVMIKNRESLKDESGIKIIEDELNIIQKIVELVAEQKSLSNELEELYKKVIELDEFIKEKIAVKYRIVFFAEIGPKWDSMDSVYRAYKAREDCDVAVVIAPIYRAIKTPTGEIKSDIIYEDFLTPMGIEHIPFKEYNIEKDAPDLAFTSQPYESVTTEQFWPENIAKYTRLVYLPYATMYEMNDSEQRTAQCQLPIHRVAWKVIAQSEKAKKEYDKYSPVDGKNIIATGLPKWDYVVNMKEKNIEMPKEWEEKLKGKKVILYNTHYNISSRIGTFLGWIKEEIIAWMEGKEDVAIIWRYHPMLDTMFKVYFPKYLEEWNATKESLRKSKNIIIDEHTEYDYAFNFSDIMISDQSSLISQYLLTGKPVYLFESKEIMMEYEKNRNVFIKYSELNFVRRDISLKNLLDDFPTCDLNKDERLDMVKEYMKDANGHVGEQVSKMLLEQLHREDEI